MVKHEEKVKALFKLEKITREQSPTCDHISDPVGNEPSSDYDLLVDDDKDSDSLVARIRESGLRHNVPITVGDIFDDFFSADSEDLAAQLPVSALRNLIQMWIRYCHPSKYRQLPAGRGVVSLPIGLTLRSVHIYCLTAWKSHIS